MLVRNTESDSDASAPSPGTTADWRGNASYPSPGRKGSSEPTGSTRGTAGPTPPRSGKGFVTAILVVLGLGLGLTAALWIREYKSHRALRLSPVNGGVAIYPSLGLPLRAAVERFDALLLRVQLTGDPVPTETFLQESRQWTSRLADARTTAGLDDRHLGILRETDRALNTYLATAGEWLFRDRPSLRRDTAARIAAEIDGASAPLRLHCEALIAAEEASGAAKAVREEAARATALRRLALIAVILLATAGVGAALAWRGLVHPLQWALVEERARQQRQGRLAELGTLAAGVVHEIRSPLTAIRTRMHQLGRVVPKDCADLAIIDGEIRRLDRILDDFLQFARPAPPRLQTVDATQLLEGIRDLVGRSLDERGVAVKLECPSGLSLDADPAQLRQVLLNLVRNAADSLSRGGCITLRARIGMDTRSKPARPVVLLEVADTGTGIAPGVQARLFEPFTSGKPGGTGLGLSIAARLVEAHGGHILCQSEPEYGTVFTVVLPRTVNPPDPASHAEASA